MELITNTEAFQKLCLLRQQYGIAFSTRGCAAPIEEILKAAPWIGITGESVNWLQCLADARGIILFDSREEMERIYEQTVGDDGPTKSNPYNGPGRVYLMTCDRMGNLLNENT